MLILGLCVVVHIVVAVLCALRLISALISVFCIVIPDGHSHDC